VKTRLISIGNQLILEYHLRHTKKIEYARDSSMTRKEKLLIIILIKMDGFVKSPFYPLFVIPESGSPEGLEMKRLDFWLRGNEFSRLERAFPAAC